jgi:D-cysteine desulfhydrase
MTPFILTTLAAASRPFPLVPYQPPSWCGSLKTVPLHGRLHLANLPTPLCRVEFSASSSFANLLRDLDCTMFVKRDDCTSGVEMGGNKIRKLEFLLADALQHDCDSVVTIGGEQSNHCRATAAAARMVGMEPHLILRSKKAGTDLGLTGNLLLNRMVGSTIYTCTPGEYGRIGSDELVARLCAHLRSQSKRPYPIPVGGSNGLGSWGYINGVDELLGQWQALHSERSLDHIVFACGSGGTAAGISLGIALAHAETSNRMPTVHAIGVCDDEDYFYSFVAGIADQMGITLPPSVGTTEDFIRQHLIVHQGKGLGYAVSTPEELDFVMSFARETGIVLDPVYSGKAMYNFLLAVKSNPESFRGQTILFWHTGGALGLFDKCDELLATLKVAEPCQRLDVYGKEAGIDVSTPASDAD